MWPYFPDLLSRPVPRYTSYPTAAEFVPEASGGGSWNDALLSCINRASGDVSLYAHIPFCEKICWYCGCNTGAANKRERLSTYLESLRREISLVAAQLPDAAKVRRIALGGGSPNAISPIQFVRLIDSIMTAFGAAQPVISVEMDPRGFTPEWAPILRATGVSHVSLGVQTFDSAVQAAIGRIQPTRSIIDMVDTLRDANVRSINFDLMYGLPGQDLDILDATLDQTLALAPERIALFGYAHVPHMLPRQRRIDAANLPDQAARFAMAARGYDRLTAAGYVAIGFDHFALPHDPIAKAAAAGQLRRNFQGFTDDQAQQLIGMGASAISIFPDAIIQNEKNAGRYRMRLSQSAFAGCAGVSRSANDRTIGSIITDILCGRRSDLSPIGGPSAWSEQLAPFVERQLISVEGNFLVPTRCTAPYARSIAAIFDQYRAPSPRQFSTAI